VAGSGKYDDLGCVRRAGVIRQLGSGRTRGPAKISSPGSLVAASVLWVPKTYATWVDALGIAVGSVKRLGVGRAGLGSAGGGMIFGLWA